ncbi:acyltransferase family protein [Psychrosphaera algicola]|uniref:Acyltransferase 3 domain-containing protein n=1 Tax=Psychrosphaera algicola TaxID=3023714 RepID=A0ABT5FEQ4_9GAMM|nr:acyltransferase family protein [Psychrosphaera sp. G1-22]MDC2890028.1 hypothetical protein [Psychrosphaera sp. G1-22]
MSGFVIAFVTAEKEKNISTYAVARISRLYSILIPALILTFTFDYIGFSYNPEFYLEGAWPFETEHSFLNYVLSFLWFRIFGILGLTYSINQPFWSLTFEWFYYIIFACAFFIRSNLKYVAIAIFCLIAGPTIVALLPIWIAGFVLFKLMPSNNPVKNKQLKAVASMVSLILMILLGPIVRDIAFTSDFIARTELFGDYFDALLFCIHIYYSPSLLMYFSKPLIKYKSIINWLASLTFSLYLFHRPIIQTIAALNLGDKNNLIFLITLFLIPLLIVVILGRWSEKQKITIKLFLNRQLAKYGSKHVKQETH